ncbi:hypothetical protein QWY14_17190 [Planococcus sp. N028]|uniref:Uncharacterized protein n=1 Tax=Planococcus shixiaomingii TaxID=3058393 RepID=A0ABT8N6M6_9BACL|nr:MULTISPECIES: hypothetical protein [unclassified Planococcus (in: firmicutes)]MDN7243527.1 hypothetical protein [Planococcus sp. N028]WKA55968.1 hypothetical protein QWY21_06270 [Planococcus sp. N022]
MEVPMNLDQATIHVEKTKSLKLKEVNFKIKPHIKEQKRLFRTSLYKLAIIAEVNNQVYEFGGYILNHKLISQLEKDPSRFLVGAEPPFLCGTNWPASGIAEVVEANKIPLDSLIITDGNNVIATVYKDEIPLLTNWFKNLID